MANHEQIANRWAAEAGKPYPKFLHSSVANVIASEHNPRDLYSYGTHFTLARIMLDANRERSWFLVNGDKYSHSTSQHQSLTRSAIKWTGLPSMIVPFSALDQARIIYDSIKRVEVLPDRYEDVARYAATLEGVPAGKSPPPGMSATGTDESYWARRLPDGRWTWNEREHHLGESVFTATYRTGQYDDDGHGISRTATFLSSFDTQERWGLYFLAELPQGCDPQTVAAAVEALKPHEVITAEGHGAEILRQGDVFAIEDDRTTRDLTRIGAARERGAYVLGVNHAATQTAVLADGTTYARGTLRHKPREWGRTPEHKMVKLGDRKGWYRLVKNTVPEGRSWSMTGNVD